MRPAVRGNVTIPSAGGIITIEEYRALLQDWTSADEQISKRIEYLESFCRNVIRLELQSYVRNESKE